MAELVDTEVFEDVVDVGLQIVEGLGYHLHGGASKKTVYSSIVIVGFCEIGGEAGTC